MAGKNTDNFHSVCAMLCKTVMLFFVEIHILMCTVCI